MRICFLVLLAFDAMGFSFAAIGSGDAVGFPTVELVHPFAEQNDRFGEAVAHHGKYLAVGAPFRSEDDILGAGRVYVFNLKNNQLVYDLGQSDPVVVDYFGSSVDIDDRYLLVGATGDSNVAVAAGAAFLYDLESGHLKHEFYAPNGRPFNRMGESVALIGPYVIVGAPGYFYPSSPSSGIAYIFSSETGELLHTLEPRMDIPVIRFGTSVAGWGNYALIGAVGSEVSAAGGGGAFLYDMRTGELIRTVVPDDSMAGEQCGWTVAINEGYITLGCFGTSLDDANQAGGAVVFDRLSGDQLHRLFAEQPTGSDHFGRVALHKDRLIVGAPDANYGTATLFDAASGTTLYTFNPTGTPHGGGNYGVSVSIDEHRVIIGTPGGRQNNIHSGFVYAYDLTDPCLSDIDGDGRFTYLDVSRFIEAYTMGDPQADLNRDGTIDRFDLMSFIAISAYVCDDA